MPLIDQDYLRRAALARINVGMLPAVPSDYDTKLDPDEEKQFQDWKAKHAPHDSGEDYDLRGAFRAGFTPDPDTGHFPDQFKKPNHETFSDESQYALGADRAKAGHWVDNSNYVPPMGMLDQAWLNRDAGDRLNVGLLPATRAAQDITASPSANVAPIEDTLTAGGPPGRFDMADKFVGVRDPQMSARSDTGATGWQDTVENAFSHIPTTPSQMRELTGGTGNPMADLGVPFAAELAKGAAGQIAQLADTGEEARRGFDVSHPNTALFNAMTLPIVGRSPGASAELRAGTSALREITPEAAAVKRVLGETFMNRQATHSGMLPHEVNNPQWFDPLQEPPSAPNAPPRTPDEVKEWMRLQRADVARDQQGEGRSLIHQPFDPLRNPTPPGTIGKVMREQDARQALAGQSEPMTQNRFDPLHEPTAQDTIGRVMQQQDANMRVGGDKSMESWRLGRPGEPGPRLLEEKFGVMQPLRGTPTEPRTTGDMDKTELGSRIRHLQSRRDEATNKFDRDYYSGKVKELQEGIPTPDWTADPWSGGMLRFRRTENPSDIGFPFRQSRVTDEHPNDQGISPPTNWPGRWTMTANRKRWDWEKASKPGTPGSETIRNEAGSEAVGHQGHWTVDDPRDRGTRGFRWQQDTDRTLTPTEIPPGTTTGLMNAPEVATGTPVVDSEAALRRMVDKVREGNLPQEVKDRLFKQADEAWRKRNEAKMPSVITGLRQHTPPPQSLGVPSPRFHPARGFDPFARRPKPDQFAKVPTNVRALREQQAEQQAVARFGSLERPPESSTSSSDQLRMFGLQKGMSPYSKIDRTIFKEETPNEPWDEYLAHPNTRHLENQAEGGINDSYEVAYKGDKDNTFFLKDITRHGNAGIEVASLDVGEMLGAEVLPAVQLGPKRLLTPWIKGKNFRDDRKGAREAIKRMVPEIRDRNTMFEFLIADPDKHEGNYFVDHKSGKVVAIDYGTALNGDHKTMGHRAFYVALRDVLPDTTPVNRAAMKDVVSKEEQVVAHLKNKGKASSSQIRGLRDRFKMLRDLADQPGEITYKDIDRLTHYRGDRY